MADNTQAELLNDAFHTFRNASMRLEQQYSVLQKKIEALNEELAEKNRAMERNRRLAAMGEMAAKIAHEIRNPLGSMALFSGILERELGAEPEKKKLAEQVSKGIKTLDNLLSNMLLFTSAPAARLKSIDIKEVVEDSLLLSTAHVKKGVEVKTAFKGDTFMMGDDGLLRQLFLNLILNALDVLGEGGVLSIETRVVERDGQRMEIKIRDNGAGIDPEHLDRIFDPFYSTKDRGTGLGLAIVSSVVNAHGGSVDVDSGDKGTVFTISLPAERGF